jgi:hypothetical protein
MKSPQNDMIDRPGVAFYHDDLSTVNGCRRGWGRTCECDDDDDDDNDDDDDQGSGRDGGGGEGEENEEEKDDEDQEKDDDDDDDDDDDEKKEDEDNKKSGVVRVHPYHKTKSCASIENFLSKNMRKR